MNWQILSNKNYDKFYHVILFANDMINHDKQIQNFSSKNNFFFTFKLFVIFTLLLATIAEMEI